VCAKASAVTSEGAVFATLQKSACGSAEADAVPPAAPEYRLTISLIASIHAIGLTSTDSSDEYVNGGIYLFRERWGRDFSEALVCGPVSLRLAATRLNTPDTVRITNKLKL
jgi:hypothetical protein